MEPSFQMSVTSSHIPKSSILLQLPSIQIRAPIYSSVDHLFECTLPERCATLGYLSPLFAQPHPFPLIPGLIEVHLLSGAQGYVGEFRSQCTNCIASLTLLDLADDEQRSCPRASVSDIIDRLSVGLRLVGVRQNLLHVKRPRRCTEAHTMLRSECDEMGS